LSANRRSGGCKGSKGGCRQRICEMGAKHVRGWVVGVEESCRMFKGGETLRGVGGRRGNGGLLEYACQWERWNKGGVQRGTSGLNGWQSWAGVEGGVGAKRGREK